MNKSTLQKTEALELVSKRLEEKSSEAVQYVVVDDSTIEKPKRGLLSTVSPEMGPFFSTRRRVRSASLAAYFRWMSY
jgi:hypothetical protein